MKKYNLKIDYSNDILPIVSGKVFHVTPTSNMSSIKETGALVPNSHLLHHSEFGNTANGFFRLKGCVSFFDYRCINTPHWEQHAYKCFPTQILNHNDSISILFLNENEYDKLIPWTMWKKEKAWSERVVPWVETGYKGNVPLIKITQEIIVEYNT